MGTVEWPDRRLRHRVQLEAEAIRTDGSVVATVVSDLSLDGCRIAGWFRIGETVELKIPKIGKLIGQVRWAVAGRAGVVFTREDRG